MRSARKTNTKQKYVMMKDIIRIIQMVVEYSLDFSQIILGKVDLNAS